MVFTQIQLISNTVRNILIQFEDMDPDNWFYSNRFIDLTQFSVTDTINTIKIKI